MAHFAEIDENGIVLRVLVVPDAQEDRGQEFLANDLGLGGTWKKTSYNTVAGEHRNGGTPFRKNYAGIGFTFDEGRDAFIPPKPFASWILDEDKCVWNAPVAMPTLNHEVYPDNMQLPKWNEEETKWDLLQPFPSWTQDATTKFWEAPTAYPTDGKKYFWNEEESSWDLIPE